MSRFGVHGPVHKRVFCERGILDEIKTIYGKSKGAKTKGV